MMEAWRGSPNVSLDLRQHEIFEALNISGLCSLEDAARLLGSEHVGDPDIPEMEQARFLSDIIREGHRMILTCKPGLLAAVLRTKGLSSPHGALPGGNVPHHAVYVFGGTRTHFDVYDPWHRAEGQPLRLTRAELVHVWTGMMLIATK